MKTLLDKIKCAIGRHELEYDFNIGFCCKHCKREIKTNWNEDEFHEYAERALPLKIDGDRVIWIPQCFVATLQRRAEIAEAALKIVFRHLGYSKVDIANAVQKHTAIAEHEWEEARK